MNATTAAVSAATTAAAATKAAIDPRLLEKYSLEQLKLLGMTNKILLKCEDDFFAATGYLALVSTAW